MSGYLEETLAHRRLEPERAPRAGRFASFAYRTFRETVYCLAALAFGIGWFTALVTVHATGLALAITFVGLPLIAFGLVLAQAGAWMERGWLGWVADERIPAPPPRPARDEAWWRRLGRHLLSAARWRETLYLLLLLPIGIGLFTIAVTLWTVAAAGLGGSIWWWFAEPNDADFIWEGNRLDHPAELAGSILVGALALVAAPYVIHGLVRLQTLLARGLLGPTRGELEAARRAAVETVVRDRRQLERDLHDGAQARLTALAVDLGRARERLEAGESPDEAAELVRAAHEQAKLALTEVRDLARGIHPAILTDRGLDAALSSLAAASPVRVTVDSDPSLRAPTEVEAAAYFVVSEALANVARHSGAERAHVTAQVRDGELVVEVYDEGRGGAAAAPGSGLAGLSDRVRGLGGTLAVESPSGGPTVVTARLPCG